MGLTIKKSPNRLFKEFYFVFTLVMGVQKKILDALEKYTIETSWWFPV